MSQNTSQDANAADDGVTQAIQRLSTQLVDEVNEFEAQVADHERAHDAAVDTAVGLQTEQIRALQEQLEVSNANQGALRGVVQELLDSLAATQNALASTSATVNTGDDSIAILNKFLAVQAVSSAQTSAAITAIAENRTNRPPNTSTALPTFNGQADQFVGWKLQIEKSFIARRITAEDEKVALAINSFSGNALTWIAAVCKTNDPETWDDLLSVMKKRFIRGDIQMRLRDQLSKCKQSEGGDLDAYINKFESIRAQIESMTEVDQLYYFTEGLNTKYRGQVINRGPRDVTQGIDMALDVQRGINHTLMTTPSTDQPRMDTSVDALSTSSLTTASADFISGTPGSGRGRGFNHGRDRGSAPPRSEHSSKPPVIVNPETTCYRCGQAGHIAAGCRNAPLAK